MISSFLAYFMQNVRLFNMIAVRDAFRKMTYAMATTTVLMVVMKQTAVSSVKFVAYDNVKTHL